MIKYPQRPPPQLHSQYHQGPSLKRPFDQFNSNYACYNGEVSSLRVKLHQILNKFKQQQNGSQNQTQLSVDYSMVTYKKVDPISLYESLESLPDPESQLEYFKSQVGLSDESRANLNRFFSLLNRCLHECPELTDLKAQFHQTGSLSSGLAGHDADLDLLLRFGAFGQDLVLDQDTSTLALNVVVCVLRRRFGPRCGLHSSDIVPSKRCPIIKLELGSTFPYLREEVRRATRTDLKFTSTDISVNSNNALRNSYLLNFLTQLDGRFREMMLLLKYWAKQQSLISTTCFSSYGLAMLVIFFLQTTQPPIFPPICKLQELNTQSPNKFKYGFCDDFKTVKSKLLDPSSNTKSTHELIGQFFEYYRMFNFRADAVCPRVGKPMTKYELSYQKRGQFNFNTYTSICIEDPFALNHNVGERCREEEFDQFEREIRKVFQAKLLCNENWILALTKCEHKAVSSIKPFFPVFNLNPTKMNNLETVKQEITSKRFKPDLSSSTPTTTSTSSSTCSKENLVIPEKNSNSIPNPIETKSPKVKASKVARKSKKVESPSKSSIAATRKSTRARRLPIRLDYESLGNPVVVRK